MEQPNPNAAPGRFESLGMVVLGTILVIFVLVIGTLIIEPPNPPPRIDIVERLRETDPLDDIERAEKRLAEIGKAGCPAMREVLRQSGNMEVKIACLQGLAHNKDFDCGPLLFDIMEQDDNEVVLRHQAYLASRTFLSDQFYNAREPLKDRQHKVAQLRAEWEALKKSKDAGK